jgi:hypothetical protein
MRKLIGAEAHARKLRAIRDIESETIQNLLTVGELIRQEAMASIRNGTIRGLGHIPSLPGEPPKGDTGRLELGITVELRATEKRVDVVSSAPHALAMEMGTNTVAERPYLRPAAAKHRSQLAILTAATISGKLARVRKY